MTEAKRRKIESSGLRNGHLNGESIDMNGAKSQSNEMATGGVLTCDEIMAVRKQHIGKSCFVHFPKSPLKIVYSKDQYLYDDKGRQYLDCMNNVTHVGHCNEDVINASHEQMSTLNTNSRFLYDNIVHYTKRLLAKMPPHLNVCYFVCSGSEANDLALQLARTHTNRKDMVVLDRAYHGHTGPLIDISPYKFKHLGDMGKKKHVHVVPCPDPYRGVYKGYGPETGELYAHEVKKAIEEAEKNDRQIAGIICESVQGCGGQIVYPENFLKTAFKYMKEAGGVCIADEVQCGFGRTGKTFWAFEDQGAIPDVVTLGKPIGNGHPLAVVVTTQEISESFAATGMSYFNTYGGNPVSCAVGNAVLDVLERDNLQQHASDVGEFFIERLIDLKQKHRLIGDVRGRGLMIGIELVKDRDTLEPATSLANEIVYRAKDVFVLVSTDGLHNNVLKIKPPMCFSKENAELVVEVLDKILTKLESNECR